MTDQPARDTVHAAATDARLAENRSVRALDRAEHYLYGDGADPITGAGYASSAAAEAHLAVAAELRALRLMLAQQLPALRPGR